jgi:3-oxoadipate enol-lactonase
VTGKVSSDGCELAYSVEGVEGRPFLLLSNSLGTSADMWADQMPSLAAAFRVIRYDTRGHGRSGAPSGEYSIEQLGRDALAVLDRAGAARAHICGLSLGGVTGMWLGVHAAERVESLVLACTAAKIGTVEMWNQRIRQVLEAGMPSIADAVIGRWFSHAFATGSPGRVASFRSMLTSTPPQGYAGCCAALRAADLREDIPRIEAPTLVISGASDPATPPAEGRAIEARINGAEMVVLDASHLANVEQPERFTQAIVEFVLRRSRHVAE